MGSYVVTGLVTQTEYYFRVRGDDGVEYTNYSNIVNSSTLGVELGLSASTISYNYFNLIWSFGDYPVGLIEVERSLSPSSGFTLIHATGIGVTGYTDTSVVSGVTYYYRIRDYYNSIYSNYSNIISGTTTNPWILELTSKSSGDTYTSILIYSSGSTPFNVTIDGNSNLYDISYSLIGKTLTSSNEGGNQKVFTYIKNTGGISNFVIDDKSRLYSIKTYGLDIAYSPYFKFNVIDIPTTMKNIDVYGKNDYFNGSLSLLPNLTSLSVEGMSGSTTSTFSDLPRTLTYLYIWPTASNMILPISGNITDLPSGLTTFISKDNSTSSSILVGDIGLLPNTIVTFQYYNNYVPSIYGNLSGITSKTSLNKFDISKSVISGAITDIPSSITSFTLPLGTINITGNITNIPLGIDQFVCNSRLSDYTSGRNWSGSNIIEFICNNETSYGLSSTEVDDLLIDLNATANWDSSGPKTLTIKGSNGARTAASNSAVTSLQGKGVTVTTN